jgi:hypothetical protein
MVVCDGPKKADVNGQVRFSGFYSCPYCRVQGRVPAKEAGQKSCGVRFPDLSHRLPSAPRTEQGNLDDAMEYLRNLQNWQEGQPAPKPVCGIKGVPLYRCLKHFDGVDSFPSDSLHTVLLGLGKKVARTLVGNVTDVNSLRHHNKLFGNFIASIVRFADGSLFGLE